MPVNPSQYFLPDTLVDWPWPRVLSPHYAEVKAESTAWVESFHPFEAKEQQEFNSCDFNLLACLGYGPRDKEYLRASCDLMNFYFVYDEYTDAEGAGGAQRLADIVMDVLHNPSTPRPSGESIVGEMLRQLWNRMLALVRPDASCIQHFIDTMDIYTASVVQEAEDKSINRLRKVEDYLTLRRKTCGAAPTFAMIEFGLDLPDEVFYHPVVSSLTKGAVELIAVINDLDSYVLELARGMESHNVVTAVMYEHNVDIAGAMTWLEKYTKDVVARFLCDLECVPSWDEERDQKAKKYINGLGYWVRGNDTWSFEATRYYGEVGREVQKTRIVKIQGPKKGFAKRVAKL